jgi:hypothetical protein
MPGHAAVLQEALKELEMPRFTRRYPAVLDTLMRQMLQLVHEFETKLMEQEQKRQDQQRQQQQRSPNPQSQQDQQDGEQDGDQDNEEGEGEGGGQGGEMGEMVSSWASPHTAGSSVHMMQEAGRVPCMLGS